MAQAPATVVHRTTVLKPRARHADGVTWWDGDRHRCLDAMCTELDAGGSPRARHSWMHNVHLEGSVERNDRNATNGSVGRYPHSGVSGIDGTTEENRRS